MHIRQELQEYVKAIRRRDPLMVLNFLQLYMVTYYPKTKLKMDLHVEQISNECWQTKQPVSASQRPSSVDVTNVVTILESINELQSFSNISNERECLKVNASL